MKSMTSFNRQNGAALVVGLILLVVVTVLAISGMNTATTELALARNNQNYENAFQAAETGIEIALAQGSFNTLAPTVLPDLPIPARKDNDKVTVELEFEGTSLVPDKAFSLGSGIAAYHFTATATAESARRDDGGETARDASAVHTQAFYVVGPDAPTL
jgi:hypothetical protein